MYVQRDLSGGRLDLHQARSLGRIRDALIARETRLKDGHLVGSSLDAVRWILEAREGRIHASLAPLAEGKASEHTVEL